MKNKISYNLNNGFTLIEIILVVAIIALLAGAIIASTSSAKNKSHKASAMQTMRSLLPYATECYMKASSLNTSPIVNVTQICPVVAIVFPAFDSKTTWGYSVGSSTTYVANNGGSETITCDAATGRCY